MKPILFNTEMVRKILSGEKTVTRRVVKPQPPEGARLEYSPKHGEALDYATGPYPMPNERAAYKAPYQPGDVLYVREKFACDGFDGREYLYVYWTDVDDCDRVVWGDLDEGEWAPSSDYNWRPSIHMPKEAARIFLRVTSVRAERLQEITPYSCIREGIESHALHAVGASFVIGMFSDLWDSTVKPAERDRCGWAANPWVWVIEFERCERPKEARL